MKSKFVLGGYFFGIAITLTAWIRYTWVYSDTDRALMYGLSGLLVLAVVYLYDGKRRTDIQIDDLEQWITDNVEGRK